MTERDTAIRTLLLPAPVATAAYWRRHARSSATAAAFVVVTVAALFAALALVVALTGVKSGDLTRDPAAAASVPVYTGAVSTLGVLIWGATASICAFTAAAIRRHAQRRQTVRMFRAAALLSTLLLLDDHFQLHENVLPGVAGVPEVGVYLLHGGLFVSFVLRFIKTLLGFEFLLLVGAALSFALALAYDLSTRLVNRLWATDHYLIEDGVTLLGISFWSAFFTRAAFASVSDPERA